MSTMSIESEGRRWIHDESPEGTPSPASYRLGCRCEECRSLYSAYMKEYRARRQHAKQRADGTAEYHTHKGQPSKRTARRWGCTHPHCLSMAGLRLNEHGVVVDATTGVVDATWGALRSPKAAA